MKVTKLFASVNCQEQNLGDLVIRRNAIELLRETNVPTVLYVGTASKDFLDAMNVRSGDVVIRTFSAFLRLLVTEITVGKPTLLFSPGPVLIGGKVRSLARALILLIVSVLVRSRGGRVISWGRGYRLDQRRMLLFVELLVEKIQRRLCTSFYVRDQKSAELIGGGAKRLPDMAFLTTSVSKHGERNRAIAMSLRELTPETLGYIDKLSLLARENGWATILVTQVSFDDELHRHVSFEHDGWGLSTWDGRKHRQRLPEVLEIYGTSKFVVSNRLHALIFGSIEGALPVPVDAETRDKLMTTLGGVITTYTWSEMFLLLQNRADFEAAGTKLRFEVAEARQHLLAVLGYPDE